MGVVYLSRVTLRSLSARGSLFQPFRAGFFVVNETISLKQIEHRRDEIYRRTRARRLGTMDDAAEFIDAVGFALLFATTQTIELPSLFEAVKGKRDAYIENWDADSDRVWVWKNDLPAMRRAYYGKVLGKPAFVSLAMLPALFAVHAPEDLNRAYARGDLSRDAKRVADALSAMGPTPTMALSEASGVRQKDFHRALDELQKRLVVSPVGAMIERGAWPSQIFEITPRWFARQAERGAKLDVDRARKLIVRQYVKTVFAATVPMVSRVFGWSREIARATCDELLARRVLVSRAEWLQTN